MPPEIDGRTWLARWFRDSVGELIEHLGGEGEVTAPQMEVIRRASGLAVLAGKIEAKILAGEELSDEEHGRYLSAINAQRRLMSDLGYERRARDVGPRLEDLVEFAHD